MGSHAAILDKAMAGLPPAALTALAYASAFPCDLVPNQWLMRLVAAEHEALDTLAWRALLASLAERSLLIANRDEAQPTARMDPLVGAHVRSLLAESRQRQIGAALEELVAGLAAEGERTLADAVEAQRFAPLVPMLSAVAFHLAGGRHASLLTVQALGICAELEGHYGETDRSLALLRMRLDLARGLATDRPDDPAAERQQAIARHGLARFLERRDAAGDTQEAAALRTEPFQRLVGAPDGDATRDALAMLSIAEADLLRGSGADGDDLAYLYYREALLHLNGRLGHPSAEDIEAELVRLYHRIGMLLAEAGDRAAAVKSFERGLAHAEQLVAARPADAEVEGLLADIQIALGEWLPDDGAPNRRAGLFHGALMAQHRRMTLMPGDPWVLRDYALNLERWGDFVLAELDRDALDHALEAYDQAMEIRRTLHENAPDAPTPLAELIICSHRLPAIHIRLGAAQAARIADAETLRLLQLYADRGWMMSRTLVAIGDELRRGM